MQDTAQSSGAVIDRETASLKIPPHSIEAEQAVLGGLLINNNVWEHVSERVSENDFYRKNHCAIFRAISKLDDEGQPYDIVTVAEWLDNRQQLDDAGGLPYLAALAEKVSGSSNIKAYADIVRKRSVLRQLIEATNTISESIFNPEGQTNEQILDLAEKTVFEIAERESKGRKNYDTIKELLTGALDKIDDLFRRGNAITGVATGYEDIDKKTAGLQPSDLIVIAGRPSMGKAQPLDAKIHTFHGWKNMGELRFGDKLASVDGNRSIVTGLYPQGIKDVYQITFSDGRSTEVCGEHLWRVYCKEWDKPRILSSFKIIEKLKLKRYQSQLWIDHCTGHFGHDEQLPIDPWALGVMLGGNDSLKEDSACFSSYKSKLPGSKLLDTASNCLAKSYLLRAAGGYAHHITQPEHYRYSAEPKEQDFCQNPLKEDLKNLGLWELEAESKYVPELYQMANKPARLAILQGILDAHGWAEVCGSIHFSSASEQLMDDIVDLARSLGAWARKYLHQDHRNHYGEKVSKQPLWAINIHHPNPQLLFTVAEKKARICVDEKHQKMPIIESITYTRKTETQCIAVSHPEHLYITDNYILTHNTALAINIAEHAVIKEKLSVAIFSMEMPGNSLAMRMMSSLGRIDQHKIRTGKLKDEDWPRLTSAVEILKDARLFIDDTPALTPSEIRSRCRRIYREHNGLDLVIVDYLQLMQVAGNSENRATEISEISRSLKAMAKELDVPVIAISQLNRSLEQRPNKRPVMSDLRESGAIEQDADLIMFIYRDEVYNEDTANKGKAELIIAKQRNGPIGMVPLTFLGQYTRFENYISENDFLPSDSSFPSGEYTKREYE